MKIRAFQTLSPANLPNRQRLYECGASLHASTLRWKSVTIGGKTLGMNASASPQAMPPSLSQRRLSSTLALLASERRGQPSLRTLVTLRWLALAGQATTITAVVILWQAPLPLVPMSALLLVLAASNFLLARWQDLDHARLTGAVLFLDVALLTGLLALSGGPSNPFSVLYLVHVMLAAIVTTKRWTWTVIATSSAGYAMLFVLHHPLPPELGGHAHPMGSESYSAHLQGMWLAYTISAVAIGTFGARLSAALRRERDEKEHTSRLLSLAALAAGAAHEIGNPLGTIRIAVGEIETALHSQAGSEELLADVKLINEEVTRAKVVLDHMASAAGELKGEALLALDPKQVLRKAACLADPERTRVRLEFASGLPHVRWPPEATSQAFSQLIRNALQASAANQMVRVGVWMTDNGIAVEVKDEGLGMDTQVLERVAEPFFTTRPGKGMGLGVFIAQTLIERMGGEMKLASKPGQGTTVSVWLPTGVLA